ncbi:MAG: metallophosphoesterase family protein [Bacillota bacterium]|jgi:putative phosphoesterase
MLYVGIISDTHIDHRDHRNFKAPIHGIPLAVLTEIKKCDLIVHCGDIGRTRETLGFLVGLAPTIAVKGNHDKHTKEKIPLKIKTDFFGWRVGITHGHGDNVRREPLSIIKFFREPLDVIMYGHIHRPLVYQDHDLILLNPGSTSSTAYTPFASFMTVSFDEDRMETKVHILDKRRQRIEKTRTAIFYK